MDLFDASVRGDSLEGRRGVLPRGSEFLVPGEKTAVAFADIQTIETRGHSAIRTVILVVVLIAVPITLLAIGMSGFEVP